MIPVYSAIYSLEAAGDSRRAARDIMMFIHEKLEANQPDRVDDFIKNIDLEKLGVHSLIGLIRISCRAKIELPAWRATYKKARKRVSDLGKDPDSIFMGLTNE